MGENAGRDAESVPIDDLFAALAEPENRYVLTYVVDSDDAVETEELVEYVVEQTVCPPSISDAEFANQVRSDVVDAALPALDAVGLVAYDEVDGAVRPTDKTETAAPHLEIALDEEFSSTSA